jgi:hypothetical protein
MFGITLGTILTGVGTALFVMALSIVAGKNTWFAAIMVALPLATILTVFMTALNKSVEKANDFSNTTFLLFWPGLAFFIVLWLAQKLGVPFWFAFAIAVVATGLATWGATILYNQLGWTQARPATPADAAPKS